MTIVLPAQDPAFYRDAFGKWRVSNPQTLFEAYFPYDSQPLLFDLLEEGTGTLTHQTSYCDLDVTASVGSRVVKQSKRYMNYQPGSAPAPCVLRESFLLPWIFGRHSCYQAIPCRRPSIRRESPLQQVH